MEKECYRWDHSTKNQRRHNGMKGHDASAYSVVKYVNGIDGRWILKHAFDKIMFPNRTYDARYWNKRYHSVWVKLYYPDKGSPIEGMELNYQLYERGLLHLLDKDNGHLENHPLLKANSPEIEQVQNSVRSISKNVESLLGQLMYVEMDTTNGQVVSIGHHFRYRQQYRDSIHKCGDKRITSPSHHSLDDNLRAILKPTCQESVSIDPAASMIKLTGRRLFSGYISGKKYDSKEPLSHGIGWKKNGVQEANQTDFSQLRGRLTFNHALEVDVSEPRFIGDAQNCVYFRPNASPKPSAVELYLKQPFDNSRNDRSGLMTYGDSSDDPSGELGGRKFYRHQIYAIDHKEHYDLLWRRKFGCPDPKYQKENELADDRNMLQSDQSSIGRFVSAPGKIFRTRLRLINIRMWELGAVLLALSPDENDLKLIADRLKHHNKTNESNIVGQLAKSTGKSDVAFAHKLGHSRAYGLGSVSLKPKSIRRLENENDSLILKSKDVLNLKESALKALVTKLVELDNETSSEFSLSEWIKIFREWIEAHRFPGQKKYHYYPRRVTRKRNGTYESTIHGYHSHIRTQLHGKLRKQEKN